jgi:hypothetical protein
LNEVDGRGSTLKEGWQMNGFSKRSGLILVAALAMGGLVGCGGDEDSTGQFVGSWKYTSGTETYNCGGTSETEQVQGNVTLNKGIASPLVMIEEGCNLAMDVSGATASARIPQECSTTVDGFNATIKFTAYTFTVNGVVADASGSAMIQASGAGGTVNCNFTQSAKLMKVSQ